jgi:hypothetical protein
VDTDVVKDADGVLTYKGRSYRRINVLKIDYSINNKLSTRADLSLIDRGANGGVLGLDVLLLE